MTLTDEQFRTIRAEADERARALALRVRDELRAERAADPVYQTWRLCLDCSEAPDSPRHQAGYRMERTAYDIAGHAYVAPPEPTPPADSRDLCGCDECRPGGTPEPEPEAPEPRTDQRCVYAGTDHDGVCVLASEGPVYGPGTYEDHLQYAGHDPSGRACALAGRVLRGLDPMSDDACRACISDFVPPMTSETDLSEQRTGRLAIDGVWYAVQRNATTSGKEWFLLTGPRGAVYALVPYMKQPTPGVAHLCAIAEGSRRDPRWAAGKTFLSVAGRLGYIR
jgi:hypothetical protein